MLPPPAWPPPSSPTPDPRPLNHPALRAPHTYARRHRPNSSAPTAPPSRGTAPATPRRRSSAGGVSSGGPLYRGGGAGPFNSRPGLEAEAAKARRREASREENRKMSL